ncbi:hypothetical protein C0J45_23862, partial [Silurus meridionalis]
ILNHSVLFSMTGDSMADSIETLVTHKVVDEGENVTLSCRYKTSAPNNNLHWYRQHPKSKPKFLLIILQSGSLASDKPARMDAKTHKDEVDLIISSTAVSDSDLYYCALV